MALADAARGVQSAVQEQLLRRLQEQQMQAQAVEHARRAEMETRAADRADRGQGLQEAHFEAGLARQSAQDALTAEDRAFTRAGTLAEQIPADTFLAEGDPSVGMMERGGRGALLSPTPALPGMGEDFQGPMNTPGGETPQAAKLGREQGRIKTQTAAQANTQADNERADRIAAAAQARQAAVDKATATTAAQNTPEAKFSAFTQRYDYEAAHPKPTTGGADKNTWVMRNGKPVRVAESGILPGDTPYSAGAAEKDAAKADAAVQADQTTHTALDLIDRLVGNPETNMPEHPGLGLSTGLVASRFSGLSQEATDANAIRDQLVATLTLPNLGTLKGPMSDRDVVFVKQLATRLGNPRLSKPETVRALKEAQTFLRQKTATAAAKNPGGGIKILKIEEVP